MFRSAFGLARAPGRSRGAALIARKRRIARRVHAARTAAGSKISRVTSLLARFPEPSDDL
jgi:hypothetical protein